MEKYFTYIYETCAWGDNNINKYNGSSGEGSSVDFNKNTYIPFFKKFITDNNIKNVVDLGCGDFRCGKLLYDDLDVVYTGYDTYKKVIDYISREYTSSKYSFMHLDFYNNRQDIINGDLYILKDVIQHWSSDDINTFLEYLIENKKCKYILLCNCSYQTQDNRILDSDGFGALSCDYLPLKKFNPTKLYNYNTKEVSVIEIE